MAKSKRYRSLVTQRTDDAVPLATAVEKLKKFGNTKFDQTVEIHMRLGVDPKQADQIIRGSVVLPHGIGKTQRVEVFAKGVSRPWRKKPAPMWSDRKIWPKRSRT